MLYRSVGGDSHERIGGSDRAGWQLCAIISPIAYTIAGLLLWIDWRTNEGRPTEGLEFMHEMTFRGIRFRSTINNTGESRQGRR
jgi:hypothetical protein